MYDLVEQTDEYLIENVKFIRRQIQSLKKAIENYEKLERKYCAELILRGYENVK